MNDIETIIDNLRTVSHCKGNPDVLHYGRADCPHCNEAIKCTNCGGMFVPAEIGIYQCSDNCHIKEHLIGID